MTLRSGNLICLVLLSIVVKTTEALTRFVGDPTDTRTQNVSQRCGGFDQSNFDAGRCPNLMRCVLEGLPADTIAGFQSGGAIAGLVSTILALIVASPMELVQLAFLSPHRALATACFGIGLPSGLFRQLRAASTNLTDSKPNAPCPREWNFRLPPSRATFKRQGWKAAGLTLVVDILIIGLAGVALYYNYRVSSKTLITWRCEYGRLVFMWPMACMLWLVLSSSILWIMSKSIGVELHAYDIIKPLGIVQLATLPYRSPAYVAQLYAVLDAGNSPSGNNVAIAVDKTSAATVPAPDTPPSNKTNAAVSSAQQSSPRAPTTVLAISMPYENSIRSWRWYEAIIETFAVGVYLHATFVLTSTQFLSGNTGLSFVTIMASCSSAVRLLESIFWSPKCFVKD